MQLPCTTSRGLAIGACNETFDWFVGEGLFGAAIIDQVAVTDGVEIVLRLCAAHVVEELAVHIDTQADEIEELFHMVDMMLSIQIGSTGGYKQVFNIFTHVTQLWLKDLLSREELTVLAKDPWVADTRATDHEAGGIGLV